MLIQNRINFTVLLLLTFSVTFSYGQNEDAFLKKNRIVKAEIEHADTHRYRIRLKRNQFAEFRLAQIGVDLIASTYDSNGKKIEEFDLTSKFGEELFTISSAIDGVYAIEIQPFRKRKESGRYTLEFRKISRKAASPGGKVDQYLARWNSWESPGLVVAVVKDGHVMHSKGYGLANLEYNIPIDSNTVFDVASVSKQFAAFSILLLEEEGKLSIDDDIRKHIPELAGFGKTITVRNLLDHTSGLRTHSVLLEMTGRRPDDIITRQQAFNIVKRQRELNFEPGTRFEYCNTGYLLLAEIVKRVSGKSFSEFTRQRIFNPLGMDKSSFPDDYQTVFPNKAYSYRVSSVGFSKSILNSTVVGSTGLVTTALDLGKWAVNFENPKIGNPQIFRRMNKPGILSNGKKTNYAMGQVIQPYKGLETFGHGGTIAGFKTFLLRVPSQKLSVIVLANQPYLNPMNTAYEIADFFLSDLPPKAKSNEIEVDDNTLNSYVGDFEILNGIRYTITKDRQQIYLQIMGGNKVPLNPLSMNEFRFKGEGRKLRFEANEKGTVNKIVLNEGIYGGSTLEGYRISIPSIDVSAVKLAAFVGSYYSDELDTRYEIVIEGNQLIVNTRNGRVHLRPFDKDSFSGTSGYLLKAKFARNKDQKVIGLAVSGVLTKALRFRKLQ